MKENALLLLLLVCTCWLPANAQKSSVDIVTMKDGKTITGKIMQYSPGSIVRIEQADGTLVEVSDSDVAKIQQGVERSAAELKSLPSSQNVPPTSSKTIGMYTASMLSFAAGNSDSEGLSLGAGFSQVFGYQFNRHLGLGAGFGIDNYSRRGETVYPLFGELRSFLPSKKGNGNFYGIAAAGYSLAFSRKQLDITEAEGGFVGHVAFGYRASTVEGLDIYLDIGPKFQHAHFERKLYNGDIEVRDVDFRRIVMRVGIGLWK